MCDGYAWLEVFRDTVHAQRRHSRTIIALNRAIDDFGGYMPSMGIMSMKKKLEKV